MKHQYLLPLVLIFVLLYTPVHGQSSPKESFLTRWQSTENYVMDMVRSVPNKLLAFQPTDSVFTLREQLTHIHTHLNWIDSYFLAQDSIFSPPDLSTCDTACLKERLRTTFQRVRSTVKSSSHASLSQVHYFRPAGRELSGYELLYLLLDHTKHHTGQLVVYLRLNGITPPRYTGW